MLTQPIHPRAANDLHLAHLLRDADVDPDMVRYLGNMGVLAAHDRKVTRDYMIEVINLNAMMNYALLKLSKASTVRHILDRLGHEECPKLDATAVDLTKEVMRYRELLADKVTVLAECPNEGDTIS